MKELEQEAMNRVLSGLRRAEPHAGLEQRVELALERRKTADLGGKKLNARLLWTFSGGGLAWATAVLIAVSLFSSQRSFERRGKGRANAPIHTSDSEAKRSVVGSGTPERGASAIQPAKHLSRPHRMRAGTATRAATFASNEVSASFLPSSPAPPAPLTEQERLLLKLAPHPSADDLALLNPEKREEIARAEMTEFQDFFKPSELEEKINAQQAARIPHDN